jgi:hypothetical protein
MNYELVFDVREAGYRYWWFPAVGLGFLALFIGMFLWRRRRPYTGRSWKHRYMPQVGVAISLFWTTVAFQGTFNEYRRMADAMATGRYEMVEGVVTQFVPMPFEGHAKETFSVAGHRYAYADAIVTAGFNTSQSHGGPIHEGLQVRIADVDGAIARLEIARDRP